MRWFAVLIVLAAAGCARDQPSTAAEACARQADETPEVREELVKGAGTASYAWWNADKLRRVRQDATLACMRSRGYAPKGGVERQRDG